MRKEAFDQHGRYPTRRCILVTGSGRNGSTLLCMMLGRVPGGGIPAEYLADEVMEPLGRRWGLALARDAATGRFARDELARYVRLLLHHRTGPFGTFATKLLAQHRWMLADHDLDVLALLPAPRVVHLTRRNVVRQAISLVRAEQTGAWTRLAGAEERSTPAPVHYDGERLAFWALEFHKAEADWGRWFDRHGLDPLRVVYEDLAADPAGTFREVLSYLRLPTVVVPSPPTERQADATTDDWEARFRAERPDLAPPD